MLAGWFDQDVARPVAKFDELLIFGFWNATTIIRSMNSQKVETSRAS
jgi:hypothetical protein